MRHRTTEPTTGSALLCDLEVGTAVKVERGIDRMGLLFLSAAGVVTVEPTIEAWIFES